MENNFTISVLITYHNEGEMLKEMLESLKLNIPPPDEILIFDDASDLPPEDFIPKNMQVRIIKSEINVGPASGRNRLLAETKCTFIHFHDSDDWFHPLWLASVKNKLYLRNSDIVFNEISSSVNNKPSYQNFVTGFRFMLNKYDLMSIAIRYGLLVPSGTIRKTCVEKIMGFSVVFWQSEDKDFYIRLLASGVSYEVICDPLVCIRIRSGSRSKNLKEVWVDGLKVLESAKSYLPTKYFSDLAHAFSICGHHLFLLREYGYASKSWQLCLELGGSSCYWRSIGFRIVKALFGFRIAEETSLLYQRLKIRK